MEDPDIFLIQERNVEGKLQKISSKDVGTTANPIKQTQKGLQEAKPSRGTLPQSSLTRASPLQAQSRRTTEPLVRTRRE
jgi:hypothetical protein